MIKLNVNGREQTVDVEPDTPLLYVLRDDLQMHGAKFGCGLGQCGACTVVIDKQAVFSCTTPVSLVVGKSIETIEGLGDAQHPGPLQQAFIDEQAAQCGYCIAGMVMRAHALIQQNPHPTEEQIRAQMQTNLCRCGTHMRILAAVRRAVGGTVHAAATETR